MFRAWVGATSRAARTARSNPQQALNETLRKLFTEQGRNFSNQTGRQGQQAFRTIHGASRYGNTRPAFTKAHNTIQRPARRGFRISSLWRSQGAGEGEKSLSLSQRFRKLSKEYGKAAVVVYFALSILDYPFFFLLVRMVGTDRVAKVEHAVLSVIKSVIPESVRNKVHEYWNSFKSKSEDELGEEAGEAVEMAGWGVTEAQERHAEEASLATQLALAYAVHKSFFFVRIPLTVAVTPKIVKTLRRWGWNIGKPRKSP